MTITLPRVSFDSETGYAYIYLAEPHAGIVKTSVPLTPADDDPAALSSLVLDFDSDGRLVGIEVLGPADAVLIHELLSSPEPR